MLTDAKIAEFREFAAKLDVTPEWPVSEPAADVILDLIRIVGCLADDRDGLKMALRDERNLCEVTTQEVERITKSNTELLAACKATLPRFIELRRFRMDSQGGELEKDFGEVEDMLRTLVAREDAK
jgi:hypothetical protein